MSNEFFECHRCGNLVNALQRYTIQLLEPRADYIFSLEAQTYIRDRTASRPAWLCQRCYMNLPHEAEEKG